MSIPPDLCIIGAGSLGIDLALHARRLGAYVVLVDRGAPEPGDAAHLALRKAALAESARRAQDMRRAPELGVGASEFRLSAKQIGERADRLVEDRARLYSPEVLTARGITIMRGPTRFADTRTVIVGDIAIKPRAVVIAIGGEAIIPDIAGLNDVAFFTPESILRNQRKLTHLVVIGGDATALELAQIQRRFGAEVTLIPQGPILPDFDPETAALLLRALREEGITIHDGALVTAIKGRSQGIGVEIAGADGKVQSLDASHLLVSMGRKADLDALDIAKAKLKSGADTTLGHLRGGIGASSSRSIRFVGDSAGRQNWSEALAEGRAAVETALGRRSVATPRIPHVVVTQPALAEISPAIRLKSRGNETILRENLAENDRAAAMGQGSGLVKVTVNDHGQIQRASIVGAEAQELAAVLSLIIERKSGLADLARLPLPRPSLFEVLSRLGENYLATQDVSNKGPGASRVRHLFRR